MGESPAFCNFLEMYFHFNIKIFNQLLFNVFYFSITI